MVVWPTAFDCASRGDRACFTRPEMKVERVSYDVMTPSAARGILEAIHWKPAIRWVIDEIHVLKPIRFQSIRRNEVGHKALGRQDQDGDEPRRPRRARAPRRRGPPAARLDRSRRRRLCHRRPFRDDRRGPAPTTTRASISTCSTAAPRAASASTSPASARASSTRASSWCRPDAPLPEPDEARTPELGFGTPRDLGFMLWDIDHQAEGRPSLFFRASLDGRRHEGAAARTRRRSGDEHPRLAGPRLRAAARRAALRLSAEKIGFVIALNEDGSVANVTDLREGEGKKRIGAPRCWFRQPVKRTVRHRAELPLGQDLLCARRHGRRRQADRRGACQPSSSIIVDAAWRRRTIPA